MKKKRIFIFLIPAALLAAVITVAAVIYLRGGSESDRHTYVALCLIEEGYYDKARTTAGYAIREGDTAAQVLTLSYLFEGDQELARQCAAAYLEDGERSGNEHTQILTEWCEGDELPGTGELLLLASTLKDELPLNAKERERLDQIVEMQIYGSVVSESILSLEEMADSGDPAAVRMAAAEYAKQGDYVQTAALFTNLVEKESEAADKIALAGLTAYAGREVLDMEVPPYEADEEIEELTRQRDELWIEQETAAATAQILELEQEIAALDERIRQLMEEVKEYEIDCAIGYLRANNRGDSAGAGINLALSALSYIQRDNEQAEKYLEQAVEQARENPYSYLSPQLNQLLWEYGRSHGAKEAAGQDAIALTREIFQGLLPDSFLTQSTESYGQSGEALGYPTVTFFMNSCLICFRR